MNVNLEVTNHSLAQAFSEDQKEALKLILDIDSAVADFSFTEELVVELLKSLREEFNGDAEDTFEEWFSQMITKAK